MTNPGVHEPVHCTAGTSCHEGDTCIMLAARTMAGKKSKPKAFGKEEREVQQERREANLPSRGEHAVQQNGESIRVGVEKRSRKKRKKQKKTAEAHPSDSDSEEEPELTGFVQEGELYLRDPSGTVYSSERNDRGKLIALGTWDGQAFIPMPKPLNEPSTDEVDNTRAGTSSVAAMPPHEPPKPLAFVADEQDHCETAPEAYAHIAGLLHQLSRHLAVDAASLSVYDPYFCNGAVKRHLAALGFPRVYNENEDFYSVQASKAVPLYDILLTNPPYSGPHPELLLDFCAGSRRPWLLLMPNWVYSRPFYSDFMATLRPQFYIVPRKRYYYWTPKGRRTDVLSGGAKAKTHGHTNAALGARTSPFISFWVGGGFPPKVAAKIRAPDACMLCKSLREIPPVVRNS
eukprot:6185353-Pleurochrysis_carterae.AAC.2